VQRYVVSNTLEHVEWEGTTVIGGDVAPQLTDLKEQRGKDIAMSGSVATVRWLRREGLLDELDLLVHPIVVGSGGRLFDDGMDRLPLQLIHSSTFTTGVVHLTYAPAAE
jgi:dihydrofolate reductase